MQIYQQELCSKADGGIVTNLRLLSKVCYLALNRANLEQTLKLGQVPEATIAEIILSVDEAVANVMEHAMPDKGENFYLTISVDVSDDIVTISLKDQGKKFNPLLVADPDMEQHVKEGRKGGLGIYIIKKIMDECNYTFDDGCNHLTLKKKLN